MTNYTKVKDVLEKEALNELKGIVKNMFGVNLAEFLNNTDNDVIDIALDLYENRFGYDEGEMLYNLIVEVEEIKGNIKEEQFKYFIELLDDLDMDDIKSFIDDLENDSIKYVIWEDFTGQYDAIQVYNTIQEERYTTYSSYQEYGEDRVWSWYGDFKGDNEWIANYFDYESFGKDVAMDEHIIDDRPALPIIDVYGLNDYR